VDNKKYINGIIFAISEPVAGVRMLGIRCAGLPAFKAGQHVTLVFYFGGKEHRRSYSLLGSPSVDGAFYIAVKRIDNGLYSRQLCDRVVVGDTVLVAGLSGVFTLPKAADTSSQYLFFAAGVGITPIYALIQAALTTTYARVLLVYSTPSAASTLLYSELATLQNEFPQRMQVLFLFSQAKQAANARLHKAMVKQMVSTYVGSNIAGVLAYVCGPFSYMRMVGYGLQEAGLLPEQIRRENFDTTVSTPARLAPPDLQAHNIRFGLQGYQVTVAAQYPTTILEAAQQAGLPLLFSCKVGQCGSCAVLCTVGKVWMSANEVLTARDLASGMVLACVGFGVDGDVSIQL
jgi:ring-1,2-phenylacetyl-CoA epoxidase subunit PaaE